MGTPQFYLKIQFSRTQTTNRKSLTKLSHTAWDGQGIPDTRLAGAAQP